MKILLIDYGGYFLDFALRCRDVGHEVRWFLGKLKGGDRNPQGDGFGLDKIKRWEESMKWADLIVIPDNSVYMDELERYRKMGFPIYGPNLECAAWELNRQKGAEVLESVGIEIIPSTKFKRLDEGMAFIKANPRRFVFKINDDNDTKALSYVAKSPKDLLFMMEKWKKEGTVKTEFILQEFCPGVEVAVGGWFGPGGFSSWFCESFEHKKFMNDEVGMNTGEMGTAVKYVERSALAEKLLIPLEGHLYRSGFTGYIDVAAIVGKDGTPYPLEFTTRLGWPLFEIQQALHPEPAEWMLDALQGQDTFRPSSRVAIGVCICIPDFPYGRAEFSTKRGYPLYGWEKIPEKNLHLTQVECGMAPGDSLKPEPVPVTAGNCICTISGTGKTVEAARAKAYKHVKYLELPSSPLYRTDIGCRLEDDLPELQSRGWCEDWVLL